MLSRLREVFASLERNEVRYVVIGGIAAIAYGIPRVTVDLDLLVEVTEENSRRLLTALVEADFATAQNTSPETILECDMTVFQDYIRVDVLTTAPGLEFDSAWARKQKMAFEGQPFFVVSLEDLIAAKEATGRRVDLEDLELLKRWTQPSDAVS